MEPHEIEVKNFLEAASNLPKEKIEPPKPIGDASYFEQFNFFSIHNPLYEYTMGTGDLRSFLEERATPVSRENGDIKHFCAERTDGTKEFFLFSPMGEIFKGSEVSMRMQSAWDKIPSEQWNTEPDAIYQF